MAVRNFYLDAEVDGRKTPVTGGPASKDGGFDLTVTQRHQGEIVEAFSAIGRARPDGTLVIRVFRKDREVFTVETMR